MATDNRTIDERLVSDILFGDQSKFGQFRGGGDKVGAALSNFINARNDARARALRNEEFNKWQNGGKDNDGSQGINKYLQYRQQGQPQVGQGGVMDAWNKMAPQGGGYFANAIQNAEQSSVPNNKYTFNEEDYIPNEKNGYHINDNPKMAEWGHPEDYQRQQMRNAMRDVYEGTDWYQLPYKNYGANTQKPVDRYPQELVGLSGEELQRAGQAYNQRIDNGYGGNFANAIVNAERAVAPQIAPTVQPSAQPNNPPPNNSPSVADFKRYDSGQGSSANSVADFKRNNSGYSAPMTEVPDPSIQYPTVASQVNKQQVVPQQSSGYKPITDFYDYNKQVRENYYPQGVQYIKDPNNPSFVDKIVDWYRGL